MRGITVIYHKKMKMSDLIDEDYHLLLLLNHLKINLGFGEKNIEVVCKEHQFDVDCFIFLANFFSRKVMNVEEEFMKLPLEPFLTYLENSHSYFLDRRLPNIRRKLKVVFAEAENGLQEMVLNFFDLYHNEVDEHMRYENNVVFPYINQLMDKAQDRSYSIDIFEERHNDIEGKVSDLKQILMKYVDSSRDQELMVNILMELYVSQEELAAHSFIEDELVIPRVRAMEQKEKIEKQ